MLLRHSRYYLALAEHAEPLQCGHDQRRWPERLDAERANLRGALEIVTGQGDAESALRIVNALTWHWFLRGRPGEARRSLRAALSATGHAVVAGRANAAAWQAGLAGLEGGRVDETACQGTADIEDESLRARAVWFLGYVMSTVGELPGGARLTERAPAGFRALNCRWGIAAALSDRPNRAMAKGCFAEASAAGLRSHELFEELGDRWGRLQSSFVLGALASIAGEYGRAGRLHLAGLRMAEELRLVPEVSYNL